MVSDFAVFLTIFTMVIVDFLIGVPSPKLQVPSVFKVNRLPGAGPPGVPPQNSIPRFFSKAFVCLCCQRGFAVTGVCALLLTLPFSKVSSLG